MGFSKIIKNRLMVFRALVVQREEARSLNVRERGKLVESQEKREGPEGRKNMIRDRRGANSEREGQALFGKGGGGGGVRLGGGRGRGGVEGETRLYE